MDKQPGLPYTSSNLDHYVRKNTIGYEVLRQIIQTPGSNCPGQILGYYALTERYQLSAHESLRYFELIHLVNFFPYRTFRQREVDC